MLVDLAIDQRSFEVFSISERLDILKSAIEEYRKEGNIKALIQSNI